MILCIENDPSAILETRVQLYRMHLHTPVLSTKELSRIPLYPAQSILILRPEAIPNIEQVCKQLRVYAPSIPLAIFYRPPHGNYYTYARMCDRVFEDNITTLTFAKTMLDLYEERTKRPAYKISYAGLSAEVGAKSIGLYGDGFLANHEQMMLVRYLLLKAPQPVPAEELRQTCFHPGKLPTIGTVHTQFRRLNKLFTLAYGKPIFLHQSDYGYFIATP